MSLFGLARLSDDAARGARAFPDAATAIASAAKRKGALL